jgi:hypothetical protein
MTKKDQSKDSPDRVAICPTCDEPALGRNEKGFPFCSTRCALLDLGKWFDGDYFIGNSDAAPPTEALRQARN